MTKQLLFHPVGNCEDEVGEKKLLLVFISATKYPTMLKRVANESYFKGLYVNLNSKSYSLPYQSIQRRSSFVLYLAL